MFTFIQTKNTFLWDSMPCTLVVWYQHFGGTCYSKMVIFILTTMKSSNLTHKLLFCTVPAQIQTFITLWDEDFDPLPTEVNVPSFPAWTFLLLEIRPLHCLERLETDLHSDMVSYPKQTESSKLTHFTAVSTLFSFHLCLFTELKQN